MNEIIIKLIELMLSVFGVGMNYIPFIFICILILFFILYWLKLKPYPTINLLVNIFSLLLFLHKNSQ